ncbi:MAG: hypothetical protein K9W44_01705 [Candidatus Lokiarchaeota archaeon]|nr:hypothetical protein [Candidatus Harpocratesius repetitus]
MKNLHKFDHPIEIYDLIEKFDDLHTRLKKSLEQEAKLEIEKILSDYTMEFVEIANRYEINLTALLQQRYNLN